MGLSFFVGHFSRGQIIGQPHQNFYCRAGLPPGDKIHESPGRMVAAAHLVDGGAAEVEGSGFLEPAFLVDEVAAHHLEDGQGGQQHLGSGGDGAGDIIQDHQQFQAGKRPQESLLIGV